MSLVSRLKKKVTAKYILKLKLVSLKIIQKNKSIDSAIFITVPFREKLSRTVIFELVHQGYIA